VDRLRGGAPSRVPPDTTYHYSNIGYLVTGAIAERAGGADLATLFRTRIIEPLHVTSTAYDGHDHMDTGDRRGRRIVSNADNRGDSIPVAATQRLYCAA
jgi:CubicO group peptidase (beta-lactamase class C family)